MFYSCILSGVQFFVDVIGKNVEFYTFSGFEYLFHLMNLNRKSAAPITVKPSSVRVSVMGLLTTIIF